MENLLARTEASQTRLNHRFTKFAHTFSNLTIEDLQLANVKRRLDQDLKLEGLLVVTACHTFPLEIGMPHDNFSEKPPVQHGFDDL